MANEALLSVLLEEMAANPRVVAALEQAAGKPVVLQSSSGQPAIDLSWLSGLLGTLTPYLGQFGPLLGKFAPAIPILITLFTGGFSPVTLAALIPILLNIFGIQASQDQQQQLVALFSKAQEGQPSA